MKLIEGKLYETTVYKSEYPDCDIEVIHSSIKPSDDWYFVTSKQIELAKKLRESNYLLNKELTEVLNTMISPNLASAI